jgi:hypothetical protein
MASKKQGTKKKKPASALPVFKQPMELQEAQKCLEEQITAGVEILKEQPSSEPAFKVTQNRMNKWESANTNRLYAITDDDSLIAPYTKDDPPPSGGLRHDFNLKQELHELHAHVRERIGKLQGILANLPKTLK